VADRDRDRDGDVDEPCQTCVLPDADDYDLGFTDDQLVMRASCPECGTEYKRRFRYEETLVQFDARETTVDESAADTWMFGPSTVTENPLSWDNRPPYEYVPGPRGYGPDEQHRIPALGDYPDSHESLASLTVDSPDGETTYHVEVVEAPEGVATFDRVLVAENDVDDWGPYMDVGEPTVDGEPRVGVMPRTVYRYCLVERADGLRFGRAEFPRRLGDVATVDGADGDVVVLPLFHPVAWPDRDGTDTAVAALPVQPEAYEWVRSPAESEVGADRD
jgi:hypothetical protein